MNIAGLQAFMRENRRLLILIWAGLVLFGVLAGFMFGFMSSQNYAVDGLAFGLGSALCWALGSLGGPSNLNNGSNMMAAIFAATSLGFLSPPVCVVSSTGGVSVALCTLARLLAGL